MSTKTNTTCPAPLLPRNAFPAMGGDTRARTCFNIPELGIPDCCLPCPKQNFFYRDEFQTLIHSTTYVNLVGVACCCFLLLSFAVLPVEVTRRHYLSVCLAFAVLLMQMSFVIPFGTPGDQCYNAITPHDMYSSLSCALSGAFLLGGGWCVVMWVFLRTLSLHLQICWQMVPGRKFFLSAQALGWSVPVVFLAIALSLTGVSFRFGESCHINSRNGIQTYWGPMLAVAAASIVTQSITSATPFPCQADKVLTINSFGYVCQVYVRSLFEDNPTITQMTASSAHGTPFSATTNTSTSVRTVTASRALRRIKRVIELQWRGIFIVIIILADVIYFSTVFLQFDGTEHTDASLRHGVAWLFCVLSHDGDKNKCLDEADKLVVKEMTAFSVLFLLSFNGIWALVLLGRVSIYPAWGRLIAGLFKRRQPPDEFVSYNARRISEPGKNSSYEMLESKQHNHSSSAGGGNLSFVIKPEPIFTNSPTASSGGGGGGGGGGTLARSDLSSSTFCEYNPSTFSAQLRGRAEGTPFHDDDLESGSRRSPLSPYQDMGLRSPPPSFSPYSDNSPTAAYSKEVRIGLAE